MNSPPRHADAADLAGARRQNSNASEQQAYHPAAPQDQSARPFRVRHQRHSGAMREYGRYADRSEADRVAKLLRWAGAVATVEAAS
jgi:hypothetical protein